MNEIIANEKGIKGQMFWNQFKYQNPSFLEIDLIIAMQAENEQLVYNVNDGLIDLRKAINRKKSLKVKIRKKQSILLKKFLTLINNKKLKGVLWTEISILKY